MHLTIVRKALQRGYTGPSNSLKGAQGLRLSYDFYRMITIRRTREMLSDYRTTVGTDEAPIPAVQQEGPAHRVNAFRISRRGARLIRC